MERRTRRGRENEIGQQLVRICSGAVGIAIGAVVVVVVGSVPKRRRIGKRCDFGGEPTGLSPWRRARTCFFHRRRR